MVLSGFTSWNKRSEKMSMPKENLKNYVGSLLFTKINRMKYTLQDTLKLKMSQVSPFWRCLDSSNNYDFGSASSASHSLVLLERYGRYYCTVYHFAFYRRGERLILYTMVYTSTVGVQHFGYSSTAATVYTVQQYSTLLCSILLYTAVHYSIYKE